MALCVDKSCAAVRPKIHVCDTKARMLSILMQWKVDNCASSQGDDHCSVHMSLHLTHTNLQWKVEKCVICMWMILQRHHTSPSISNCSVHVTTPVPKSRSASSGDDHCSVHMSPHLTHTNAVDIFREVRHLHSVHMSPHLTIYNYRASQQDT